MINYFNSLLGVNIPFWSFIAVLMFLALGFCVYWFVRTRVFKSRLRQIIKTEDNTQIKEDKEN